GSWPLALGASAPLTPSRFAKRGTSVSSRASLARSAPVAESVHTTAHHSSVSERSARPSGPSAIGSPAYGTIVQPEPPGSVDQVDGANGQRATTTRTSFAPR